MSNVDEGILFDESNRTKKLHPAIDMIDDVFYLGFQLPVTATEDTVSKDLCFVTSKREAFKRDSLGKRNLSLRVPSVMAPTKWDLHDMGEYLNGCNSQEPNYSLLPFLIQQKLLQFLDLTDKRASMLISLWIIGTYLQPIWDSYPYLSVSGTPRAGKSKLLKFIAMLGFNSIFSTSMSTAMLYRLIESLACTMLLDESEKFSSQEKQEEIRNIINSGYKKYGKVYRSGKTSKGQIVPEQFETFSPKVIVTYRGLEAITEDRCIPVTMLRSRNKVIVNKDIHEDNEEWQPIRNQLYRFALDRFWTLEELYRTTDVPVPHEDYMSRERELWKPILTLASYFGLADNIVPYVVDTIEKRKQFEQSTPTYILLEALLNLVKVDNSYTNAEIRGAIAEMFGADPMPAYITPSWVGNTLVRQFNIKEGKRKGTSRGYFLSVVIVKELCLKYGVDPSPPVPVPQVQPEESRHSDGVTTL